MVGWLIEEWGSRANRFGIRHIITGCRDLAYVSAFCRCWVAHPLRNRHTHAPAHGRFYMTTQIMLQV